MVYKNLRKYFNVRDGIIKLECEATMKNRLTPINYKKIPFNTIEQMPEGSSAGKLQDYLYENRTLPAWLGKDQRKITILADTHLLPKTMIRENDAFFDSLRLDGKLLLEGEDILDAALEKVYGTNTSILLLPGDLTRNGELKALKRLEEKLLDLRLRYDKEGRDLYIFGINGNHDMNNMAARDYSMTPDSVKRAEDAALTERVGPKEFESVFLDEKLIGVEKIEKYKDSSIYKDYLENVRVAFPNQEYVSGGLSYTARVPMGKEQDRGGLSLIALDTAAYSSDVTADGTDSYEVEGQIVWPLIEWTLEKIKEAKKRKDMVALMAHHGFIPHLDKQDLRFGGLVKTWNFKYPQNKKTPAEAFADAGVNYIFTGHLHTNDISRLETEEGNEIFDIETGSIVDFPSTMRTAVVTKNIERENIEMLAVETSIVENVVYHNERTGEKIPIPDLANYKNKRYFTPDRVVLFLNIQLRSGQFEEIQRVGLRTVISALLEEDYGDFIRKSLPKWLGTSRKRGKQIVNRYFSLHYDEEGDRIVFTGPMAEYYIKGEDLNDLISNILHQIDQQYLQDTKYIQSKFYELGEAITSFRINEYLNVGDIVSYAYLRMAKGNENDFYDLADTQLFTSVYPELFSGNILRKLLKQLSPLFLSYILEVSGTIKYKPKIGEILHKKKGPDLYRTYIVKVVGDNLRDTLKLIHLERWILDFFDTINLSASSQYLIDLLDSMVYENYKYMWANDSKFIQGRVLDV